MGRGSVETLSSGFRARVYAGKDPITGKQPYVKGPIQRETGQAEQDRDRLLEQVEAGSHPDRAATVAVLMTEWMEVADHQLTTRDNTASSSKRMLVVSATGIDPR
jgi:integrase